ncbi:MAG TPA: PEP/pyruvate-binding domain-containing protein [Coleofasciculaceae cyanobacterium]
MNSSRHIIHHAHVRAGSPLGGKAGALAILEHAGVPVPGWLLITPEAFYDSLTHEQRHAIQQLQKPEEIRTFLTGLQLRQDLQDELNKALQTLCPGNEQVAVRSSALDEDGSHHSFAGQLESYLFVSKREVVTRVADVWRSGFNEKVWSYRTTHGLTGLAAVPLAPAVLVQKMVNATVAGVAFGADPISGELDKIVISGLPGLGDALVSGESNADIYHVNASDEITYRHLAKKVTASRYNAESGEGTRPMPLTEAAATNYCLTDEQIITIAQWVRYCGVVMGYPQDVEWAFADGQLYILQSRPLTIRLSGKPGAYYYYWDNDDLDSWTGVTTPLTFSFIRRFYAAKFRHLSQGLGVPESRIREDEATYQRILGLIEGRIYYNVAALEEVWKPVPGFRRYRNIFNDWIGMEDAPDTGTPSPLTGMAWLREHGTIFNSLGRLILTYRRWDQEIEEFFREVNQILILSDLELGHLNMDRLLLLYHRLEKILHIHWAKPTMNNFFASFFYTQLAKRTRDWCGDPDMTLRNNLLCGEGGVYSSEPIRYLEKLARLAMESPALVESLCKHDVPAIEAQLEQAPHFTYHLMNYLRQYGRRCHESSKLESPNIADEPLLLFRTLGQFARRLQKSGVDSPIRDLDSPSENEQRIRDDAERLIAKSLKDHPWRKFVFQWILRHARARVKDRENMRFVQTQMMGRIRAVFLHFGRCFQEEGLLEDVTDIFYLEVDEVIAFVEGRSTCVSLRELAALRKREFEGYRNTDSPPDCFETLGSAHLNRITTIYNGDESDPTTEDLSVEGGEMVLADQAMFADSLQGISCSPGKVSGPVRLLKNTSQSEFREGDILVAQHGDPGLVMLFPVVGGLIFERGSPLSHLSIVAREMGIPTIAGLEGLSDWLSEGEWVEMDGKTGQIRKLSPEEQVILPDTDKQAS